MMRSEMTGAVGMSEYVSRAADFETNEILSKFTYWLVIFRLEWFKMAPRKVRNGSKPK